MLLIINPRTDPEATFLGWIKHNAQLIAIVVLWSAALLAIAAFGRSANSGAERWYSVSFVEGIPNYHSYTSEEECLAAVRGDIPGCVGPQSRNK
jgi:hypothetical protein